MVTTETIARNERTVRRLYESILNQRQFHLLNEIVSEQFQRPSGEIGIDAFVAPLKQVVQAFPDAQWSIDEIVCTPETTVVRHTVSGTHSGIFQGITPTGKVVNVKAVAFFRFKEELIIGSDIQTDRYGFMQQLGLLPEQPLLIKTNSPDAVMLIDKFTVPVLAESEFRNQVSTIMTFIRTIPGFLRDEVFKSIGQNQNLDYLTIVFWENKDAFQNAAQVVQREFAHRGFEANEMFKRLGITLERNVYSGMRV